MFIKESEKKVDVLSEFSLVYLAFCTQESCRYFIQKNNIVLFQNYRTYDLIKTKNKYALILQLDLKYTECTIYFVADLFFTIFSFSCKAFFFSSVPALT